jgi:hypothetical protein
MGIIPLLLRLNVSCIGNDPIINMVDLCFMNGNESLSDGVRNLLVVMGMGPLLMRYQTCLVIVTPLDSVP